jgi:hypothetical protein
MKKVLFSLTYYTPYVSGLTIYVSRIASKLSEKGIDVTILTSQHIKNIYRHSEERSDEESPHNQDGPRIQKNIHVIRVPYLFKISKG